MIARSNHNHAEKVKAQRDELLAALKELDKQCAMTHKYWGEDGNLREANAAVAAAKALIAEIEGA